MNKIQKDKIRKSIKKAWKEGRYKNAFKSKSKKPKETEKQQYEVIIRKAKEENLIPVILENGDKVMLVIFGQEFREEVLERLDYAIKTSSLLSFGSLEVAVKLFNAYGAEISVLNGRKIIGYSL